MARRPFQFFDPTGEILAGLGPMLPYLSGIHDNGRVTGRK
jgi:hypothetical protein